MILGGSVAVCVCLLLSHRAVIFTIGQLSCYNIFPYIVQCCRILRPVHTSNMSKQQEIERRRKVANSFDLLPRKNGNKVKEATFYLLKESFDFLVSTCCS